MRSVFQQANIRLFLSYLWDVDSVHISVCSRDLWQGRFYVTKHVAVAPDAAEAHAILSRRHISLGVGERYGKLYAAHSCRVY